MSVRKVIRYTHLENAKRSLRGDALSKRPKMGKILLFKLLISFRSNKSITLI